MSEFKQCVNGHFYQGESCPYCPKVQEQNCYCAIALCGNSYEEWCLYCISHNKCLSIDGSLYPEDLAIYILLLKDRILQYEVATGTIASKMRSKLVQYEQQQELTEKNIADLTGYLASLSDNSTTNSPTENYPNATKTQTQRNYNLKGGRTNGQIPPTCSKCGNPLRKENRRVPIECSGTFEYRHVPEFGYVWNDSWNGVCENCGFDCNLQFTQNLGNGTRVSSVRIADRRFPTYSSCDGEVLSGVELEITSQGRYFSETQRIFISTNELKHLLKMLENSPILKQYDWGEDWSYEMWT